AEALLCIGHDRRTDATEAATRASRPCESYDDDGPLRALVSADLGRDRADQPGDVQSIHGRRRVMTNSVSNTTCPRKSVGLKGKMGGIEPPSRQNGLPVK